MERPAHEGKALASILDFLCENGTDDVHVQEMDVTGLRRCRLVFCDIFHA